MNQRRRLLTQARKGDQKSIDLLFELYQVKVFSGEELKKKKLPSFPVLKASNGLGKGGAKGSLKKEKTPKSSLADKAKKEKRTNQKAVAKQTLNIKTKVQGDSPVIKKAAKSTLKKEKHSESQKARPKQKTAFGEKAKSNKSSAIKKPRIAKKK
ncbi:MAG: hypothetical protein OEY57_10655 [Nitrospirota bacterium]|nr:hypothetical protein [Nitrospirota bacterium]